MTRIGVTSHTHPAMAAPKLEWWFSSCAGAALPFATIADTSAVPAEWEWNTERIEPDAPTGCALCDDADCEPRRRFGKRCSHTFHESCLRELFDHRIDACPLCREGRDKPSAIVWRVPPVTVQLEGTPE